jgi:hypothetical protein
MRPSNHILEKAVSTHHTSAPLGAIGWVNKNEINSKLERLWEEVVKSNFKVVTQNLPCGTEKRHKRYQDLNQSCPQSK